MTAIKKNYFEYGQKEMDYLISVDGTLGSAMLRIGILQRAIDSDMFTALVYAIVGQLISVKAANTIWGRLQNKIGEITLENMAKQTAEDIQSCGMTMKKAVNIKNIAHMIADGSFLLNELDELSDEEVINKLTTLNGVGKWTAEMILIHAMGRLDVVSWGDIAIRRGMMKLYGLDSITKEQFEQYRLIYSPFGSVASLYLWEISAE